MDQSFLDLGVSAEVVRGLAARGVTAPFAVQSLVIPDALAGRDVLVRSRTGSGKTLAFAIPIVERIDPTSRVPMALILAPTRELAQQVAAEMKGFAGSKHLRIALAYGGAAIGPQIHAVRKAHVIVATPGRLEDLLNRRAVSLDAIRILVLDEADHMLDMGFLPQVDKIVARLSAQRQTMLFSATLDGEVGRIAGRYTNDAVRHEISTPKPATADVEHHFVSVQSRSKTTELATLLRDAKDSTLVFVRTKHGADRLVRQLADVGIHAAAMHGNKSQSQREQALSRFASGRVTALVATDVAARGIDVDKVARVVNYDIPADDKTFVHRVGRTGRAGRTGISITYVSPEQEAEVGRMAAKLKLHREFSAGNMTAPAAGSRPSSGGSRSGHRPTPAGTRARSRSGTGGPRGGTGSGGGNRGSSGSSAGGRSGGSSRSASSTRGESASGGGSNRRRGW